MEKETRNRIQRATQEARNVLEREYGEQLEGIFDIRLDGSIAAEPGSHLDARQRILRAKLIAAVEHQKSLGLKPADTVTTCLREFSFTTLNRFVALKMLEARGLLQECISKGDQSAGFKEFTGLAPGLVQLPDHGYRLYLESVFEEIGTEVRVLFDRQDPAALLWPRRQALSDLLDILNDAELAGVWNQDETIGWIYQYFNGEDERRLMRAESSTPRNSRELAVRNQFFTPRYVVEFLADNTLGRTWIEMHGHESALSTRCRYLVHTANTEPRTPKDPRELKILDPACGSGHFLLYCFDLLLTIYEEAWQFPNSSLRRDYPEIADLRRAVPALILENNLHGVDIDPRAAQIGALALWLRAQRAWNDMGVPRTEWPPVRRTHIVVAEPMPGDSAMVEEFASRLNPPLLRDLFRKMTEEMNLAGELGTLAPVVEGIAAALRRARKAYVEHKRRTGFLPGLESAQGTMDFSGIDDDRFFQAAEHLIMDALMKYAETAANGRGTRRRLFAGDAVQGIALIEILRRKYDVVLMNPPFGAISAGAKEAFEKAYPRTKQDLFAAFVERGLQLLHPRGLLGAITSRTGFFLSSFQKWREEILLKEAPPVVFVDLGYGVMDSAMVEAAAYCLEKGSQFQGKSVFLRALETEDKASAILAARTRFEVDPCSFAAIPRSPFAYWASDRLRSIFQEMPPLESDGRTAKQGLATADDFRFVRTWWEVPPERIGSLWCPFAKGGEFSRFYADVHLVVNWLGEGREIIAWGRGRPQNVEFFFRPGVTWPRRTQGGLSMRAMPQSSIFADKGPALFCEIDCGGDLLFMLGVTNSRPFRELVDLQMAFGSYEVGVIQRTPIPHGSPAERELLSRLVKEAWSAKYHLDRHTEASHAFTLPALLQVKGESLCERIEAWQNHASSIDSELEATQAEIDTRCFELYGFDEDDRRVLGEEAESVVKEDSDDEDSETEDAGGDGAVELASWLLAAAFGRFDVRLATGAREMPAVPGPFDPLPVCPPGMLTGEDGLALSRPPAGYPIPFPETGILVDDPGHRYDITAALRAVVNTVFGAAADRWWGDLSAILDPANHEMRNWVAGDCFEYHLKRYSKSRRRAPIFWQLSIPSRRYSVWLYAHRLTRDSFFRVFNDYVVPKLEHEERELEVMRQTGESSSAARKRMAEQESLVDEIRTFRDEIARIAPLWNPDLNDGVIINFAPLWRLTPQHKAWQKECKECWDKLAAGDYDWAHLAMHLWPERVVPKCAEDRSLAIAHGLEEVFWTEGAGGKWQKRKVEKKVIDQLIAERTSPAVKSALESLLEASASTNGIKGKTKRNRRAKVQEAR